MIALGATDSAGGAGATGPRVEVTVTVTRFPWESVTITGAAVGQAWVLPRVTVNRPGCVLELDGEQLWLTDLG